MSQIKPSTDALSPERGERAGAPLAGEPVSSQTTDATAEQDQGTTVDFAASSDALAAAPATAASEAGNDTSTDDGSLAAESRAEPSAEEDLPDFDRRFLCADGACIGVIGSNGRCRVCDTEVSKEDRPAFERAWSGRGAGSDSATEKAHGVEEAYGEEVISAAPDASSAANSEEVDPLEPNRAPDLERRVLCSDGACIGVVGVDNRCKVCGRPGDAESSDNDECLRNSAPEVVTPE